MEIIERKFTRPNYSEYFLHKGVLRICRRAIRRVFNIPNRTEILWFVLHDAPHPDREPIHVKEMPAKNFGGGIFRTAYPILQPRNAGWFSHYSLDEYLNPYIGKTVYLEVWYETPKGA